jgi:LysM repeat protein
MVTQLQKAYLEVESGGRVDAMFNPTTFAFSTQNNWESDQIPGKNTPSLRYAGGAGGTFDLSLVFDTTDTGKSVTTHTDKLLKLLEVDEELAGYDAEKNNGRPPWVKFHWGTHLHSFKAVITSANISFTYFAADGLPLRASVDLSLKQYEPDANWGPQNPTSRTPKPKRTHQVQVGDTLDRIAARYYGDPTKWRDIATLNGVADPLDLAPGRLLSVPERGT